MYACMCVCIYIYICTCIHIYIYIHIYMYDSTYRWQEHANTQGLVYVHARSGVLA